MRDALARAPRSRAGRSLGYPRHSKGRVALRDSRPEPTREWHDPGSSRWAIIQAPHAAGVAYVATRKSVNGEARSLMLWGGGGEPRELLRTGPTSSCSRVGQPEGLNLLVARGQVDPTRRRRSQKPNTVASADHRWTPVSTGLMMDRLRDVSIHPDGRRVAFNAGRKRVEHWVMENVLPK